MRELMPVAEKIAALLKQRKETISVVESSAGGLISAALLAVPGASAYFIAGSVTYTRQAWRPYRDFDEAIFTGTRAVTEPNALIRARFIRKVMATDWGVSETGAAGPTGNTYSDPAGQVCVAIAGRTERVITLSTGSGDRLKNMYAFAGAALGLLAESLAGERA
jgi:PncC family amidohydrolase